MINTIALRADYVMHAYRFVSTDKYRTDITGLYLRSIGDGLLIVATDGHRLGAFLQTNEHITQPVPNRDLIISVEPSVLKACKAGKRDYNQRWLVFDYESLAPGIANSRVVMAADAVEACSVSQQSWLCLNGCVEIDSTFPDIVRFIGSVEIDAFEDKKLDYAYNPAYLESFGFTNHNGPVAIRMIKGRAERQATIILNNQYPEFFGMLMPFGFNGEIPEWVKHIKA